MRVHGFVDEGVGHASYVVELSDGTAAVVDPPPVPTGVEPLTDRLGVRMAWTLDTHSRADYMADSPALEARSRTALLTAGGHTTVAVLAGGPGSWTAATGCPLATDA